MIFTEEMLSRYALPLSETEKNQCENAIRMVIEAIKPLGFYETNSNILPLYENTYSYYQELKSVGGTRKIKVFLQGSYANNTNVRSQSDVDIAIVQEDVFRTTYREGVSKEDYGYISAEVRVKTFKDEVEEALKAFFSTGVERKDKSIKVNGNTYRKDADAVPCIRHKDYTLDFRFDPNNFIGGIVITSDSGDLIINYPEQHIRNGKEKNRETNHHYKKMVRVMKQMKYLMQNQDVASAGELSSFALESLMWNIPNQIYIENSGFSKLFLFKQLVEYLKDNKHNFSIYKEANGIKGLCSNAEMCLNLKKFIDELWLFYRY